MQVLIVGNVLKDVYLKLDERTEELETDRAGTKWLDFSFNASDHHYFRRTSNFGGAAVTMEVLEKMGLSATIDSSDFSFNEGEPSKSTPADAYRYILTTETGATYLTPTVFQKTEFKTPNLRPDYIFIDRSANLDMAAGNAIKSYLDSHPEVGLVLHFKPGTNPVFNSLLSYANLVFLESFDNPEIRALDPAKVIFLSNEKFSYKNIAEPVAASRVDTLTHLSMYSIAAATVLGGFLIGKTVEMSLKLARANVENATLDSCLTLKELETAAAIMSDNPRLLAAAYVASEKGVPKSLVLDSRLPRENLSKFLKDAYSDGFRFAPVFADFKIRIKDFRLIHPTAEEIEEKIMAAGETAAEVLNMGMVPIVKIVIDPKGSYTITKAAEVLGKILDRTLDVLRTQKIDFSATILEVSMVAAGAEYREKSNPRDVALATAEVLKRHMTAKFAGVVLSPNGFSQKEAGAIIEKIISAGTYATKIILPPVQP